MHGEGREEKLGAERHRQSQFRVRFFYAPICFLQRESNARPFIPPSHPWAPVRRIRVAL